jgi:predicted double-glycine peptidase
MSKVPPLVASLALVIALTGVAAPDAHAGKRRAVKSLLEMRHEDVVVQKWDLSCGAAAIATLLQIQYGDRVPEREVAGVLIRRKEYIDNPDIVRVREGFSLLDLKRFVETRGYEGIGLGKMTFDDLVEGGPAIVPVEILGYRHFVVFRGVFGDRVLLADPAFGNRTLSIAAFEEAWMDSPVFGQVAFQVRRPGAEAPQGRLVLHDVDLATPPDALLRGIVSSVTR